MRVDAQGNRGVAVPQLATHVGDRRALLQQQRGERVPHLMRAATVEASGIKDAIEGLSHIRFI